MPVFEAAAARQLAKETADRKVPASDAPAQNCWGALCAALTFWRPASGKTPMASQDSLKAEAEADAGPK